MKKLTQNQQDYLFLGGAGVLGLAVGYLFPLIITLILIGLIVLTAKGTFDQIIKK